MNVDVSRDGNEVRIFVDDDPFPVEFVYEFGITDSDVDADQAIDHLSRRLSDCGDRLEESRWEEDPVTGAPGPLDRGDVGRRLERIIDELLPHGIEVKEHA